jgi:multidrug efflux pump subunit AcrB
MLPAQEEILSIQPVTNNKYARQVRSCAAGFNSQLPDHVSKDYVQGFNPNPTPTLTLTATLTLTLTLTKLIKKSRKEHL